MTSIFSKQELIDMYEQDFSKRQYIEIVYTTIVHQAIQVYPNLEIIKSDKSPVATFRIIGRLPTKVNGYRIKKKTTNLQAEIKQKGNKF